MRLAGKTALVTGASRGIGRAIALRLAAEGARVVIHYTANKDQAADVVREVEAAGGQALTVAADLTDVDQIGAMFEELAGRIDGLDILVNNAGRSPGFPFPFEKMTPQIYDQIFNLNARGAFFVIQQALPLLRDNGRIINISSNSSKIHQAGQSVYSGSKAALDAFTRNLAHELAPRGITINSIQPTMINTGISSELNDTKRAIIASIPLGRIGSTDDVNGLVVYFASDEASWISGQEVLLTGGL